MMKKTQKSTLVMLLLLIVALLAVSCGDDKNLSLNETEYYYNYRLSSISAEGDTAMWVGTEFGDAYWVNDNNHKLIQFGDDRIYKVLTERYASGKRLCWVGERNAGLTQWEISDNGQARRLKAFPISGKGQHYSVYDIVICGERLFAATSQGIFVLNSLHDTGSLQPVYPNRSVKGFHDGDPFVAKTICPKSKEELAVATQDGLLTVNVHTLRAQMAHRGEGISYLAMVKGRQCVLAGDRFYIEDCHGKKLREIELDFHANLFCHVGDTYYFLDNDRAVLSRDLKTFITIPLRRKISSFCNNVFIVDNRSGYVALATENAVWQVPEHQSVFNDNAPIVAAAADRQGNTYYISARNEIFMQLKGSNEANKIFDFLRESPIVAAKVHDGILYFVNSRRELKKIDLSGSFVRNLLLARKQLLYKSQAKITALGMTAADDSLKLYLGVQDGLVEIDAESGKADTIQTFSDKYITGFYAQGNDNNLYFTTLNHGIYYGRDHRFRRVEGTAAWGDIRSMTLTNGYPSKMVVLSGNTLIMGDSTSVSNAKGEDFIVAMGNDLVYSLPELGLRKYQTQGNRLTFVGNFYNDVRFHRQALVANDTTLLLGCELGVLHIEAGHEARAVWVDMHNSYITRRGLVSVSVGLLLLLLLFFWGYRCFRKLNIRQILVRKDDLKRRLAELESVCNLLPGNYTAEITHLCEEINRVSVGHHGWKQTNLQMAGISDTIMRMNRNTALLLLKKIDAQCEQLSVLELTDSKQLVADSRRALEQGEIEVLRAQALNNEAWLNNYRSVKEELAFYVMNLTDVLLIEGVTQGLCDKIEDYKGLLTTKPMAALDDALHDIREQYKRIFQPETLPMLEHYFAQRRRQLIRLDAADRVVMAVRSQLESVTADMLHQDRLQLFRQLKHTDERIRQVLLRSQLAMEMKAYVKTHEAQYSVGEITRNIAGMIAEIYECMSHTDPRLVNSILKFNGFDNQQAKVLMLLVADHKVKRTEIPGMLRVMGNLNPVISRLVKNKLKPEEDALQLYINRHPASLAVYIQQLLE